MKKFTPLLVVLVFVGIIVTLFLSLAKVQNMVVVKEGNQKKLPLPIVPHKYQDSFCGMVIDDLTYASEVVVPDGKTYFFHDHADFVQWLSDKRFQDSAVIWVHAKDTNRWIDGRKAFYSLNERTPMESGFGAYEHQQKGFVDFKTMQLKALRGETMKNPKIRKKLLEQ